MVHTKMHALYEILKVPVFVGRVFFILIRNLDLQKGVC